MGEWKTVTLGDVTVNYDARRVPIRSVDRKNGPYPYYGASGIVDHVDDFLFEGDYLLIAEDGENLRTRSTPIAFMAANRFWVNNHAHIVQGNNLANTKYLCYVLSETNVSGYLSGSTQPKLTQAAMNRIALRLPERKQQDAIVTVLGALDDKIAVNERIAVRAEDLAILFAHQDRWLQRARLGELVHHMRDQVTPEFMTSETVAHYSLPAFDVAREPEMVSPTSIKSGKFLVTQPCVLLSKLNPSIPRVWLVDPSTEYPALASTEFLVLVPAEGLTPAEIWAVCSQSDFTDELASKATGTSNSHQRVRPADLLATEVVDPRSMPLAVRRQLRTLTESARVARTESHTLRQLRDTLLPKLMSGELRVREAEKIVGGAL